MERYCPYCGVLLHTDTPFCTSCGAAISDGNLCKNCGNSLAAGMRFCPRCGASCGGARHIQHFPPAADPVRPMKWFYFLIYFGLWVVALGSALRGILFLHFASQSNLELIDYPAMEVYYRIGGILQIVYAVYLIYTRFQLSNFRLQGPTLLFAAIWASIAFTLLSAIFFCIIGYAGVSWGLLLVAVLMSTPDLGLYFANRDYFAARAKLFIY